MSLRRRGRQPVPSGAAATGLLIAAASAGAERFEAVVAPHYAPLIRRLVLVLGNEQDAQDVAQDAYLAAFRSWDRFDGADAWAWLYTIALRLAFNQLRGHKRLLAAIGRIQPQEWVAPSDPDLWAALKCLNPRIRAALLLTRVDGFTQLEVARILSVPEGTVASWLSRARVTLRRELDRDHDVGVHDAR